jgi:hypothetical protein
MTTLGGPATAAPGTEELGLAVGAYGEGFSSGCYTDIGGGPDWLVRWRRGVTGRTDLGFDVQISNQSDGSDTGVFKIAARYLATPGLRLEGGIGAADSGDGRSVNADLAAEIGTHRSPDMTWNYYASLRLAGSHGCYNLLCLGGTGAPGSRAPGGIFLLGAIGSTARITSNMQFVMEAGMGNIQSAQQPATDLYYNLSFGLLFHVGKTTNPKPTLR